MSTKGELHCAMRHLQNALDQLDGNKDPDLRMVLLDTIYQLHRRVKATSEMEIPIPVPVVKSFEKPQE